MEDQRTRACRGLAKAVDRLAGLVMARVAARGQQHSADRGEEAADGRERAKGMAGGEGGGEVLLRPRELGLDASHLPLLPETLRRQGEVLGLADDGDQEAY